MTQHPDGRYVDDAPYDPDAALQQLERADLDAVQRELREVPGVSVLIYDQTFRSALMNPDQVVVMPHINSNGPDAALVDQALSDNYTVLMPPELADEFVSRNPGFSVTEMTSGNFPRATITRK